MNKKILCGTILATTLTVLFSGCSATEPTVSVKSESEASKERIIFELLPEVNKDDVDLIGKIIDNASLEVDFLTNSSILAEQDKENIKIFAKVANQWNLKKINVAGHADYKGSSSYNLKLAKRRAIVVADEIKKYVSIEVKALTLGSYNAKCMSPKEKCLAKNRKVMVYPLFVEK